MFYRKNFNFIFNKMVKMRIKINFVYFLNSTRMGDPHHLQMALIHGIRHLGNHTDFYVV